jgi:trans-2,3-dihydro-3-hydroxyanthranilate isomerase
MITLDFYIVDVFTTQKYGGNQLGVFVDYEDLLSDTDMLQITRELNFPEVTFIKHNYENLEFTVRIFTPEYEVPFAGHPTLGTAFIISKYLIPQPKPNIALILKQGTISVQIEDTQNIDVAKFTMTQTQPLFLDTITHKSISEGLGIEMKFLDAIKPIEEISTGLPYIIIPLKSLYAINNLNLDYKTVLEFLKIHKKHKSNSKTGLTTSLFFITEETFQDSNQFNARMFCIEGKSIIEDAATGSANGCLLAYLLKHQSTEIRATVEQGFQMGRKSYIYLDGKKKSNTYQLKIGGNVVDISKGQWKI